MSRLAGELEASEDGRCYIDLMRWYLKNISGNVGRWEQFAQILKFSWRLFMFIVTRGGGN